jgi:hypothetical protein
MGEGTDFWQHWKFAAHFLFEYTPGLLLKKKIPIPDYTLVQSVYKIIKFWQFCRVSKDFGRKGSVSLCLFVTPSSFQKISLVIDKNLKMPISKVLQSQKDAQI